MKRHLIKIISALLISVVVFGFFYFVFSFSVSEALIQATTVCITLLILEYMMPWISKKAKLFPGDNNDFRPIKLRWGKRINHDNSLKNHKSDV